MLNSTGVSPRSDGTIPEHQRRVDELQARVRAEGDTVRQKLFKLPRPRPDSSTDPLDHRIAEEIEGIRRHLDLLGGTLVGDPAVLHRHGTQLQSIDRLNQVLGHLARIIAAEQKDLAVDQVTLQDLRSRLLRQQLCTPTSPDR
jgi:hypothetical protein